MKLTISKDILLENLNYVSRALSNKNIIPVLNGILFELKKSGLNLTATDNDITIKTFIDKKDIKSIDEEGSVVIYGRFILDIIRKLPNDEINIEMVDGNKVIISTETSKYDLNCYDENDFPNIKLQKTENPIILKTDDFKKLITQTSFAVSMQESRPLLTGININIKGNNLECVATDSYRLAKKIIEIDNKELESVNIVIPGKNINELVKIIEGLDEEIELHLFPNKIMFAYKNILFQSSLLNGTYPNTDTLIPTEYEIKFEANLQELYNAIDRVSLLTQSKEKNIVGLEMDENKLIITSNSPEIGKSEEIMYINNLTNNNINISFSAKYMLDALKTFDSENIKVLLNGEIKPIILKENEESNLTQLILPIKTY